jgi:hypothetical protein
MKPRMCNLAKRYFVIMVALAAVSCAYMPASMSGADASFTAVEKDGTKVWEGGGTVDLKGRTSPVTLTVKNTLNADHGFSIDSMKVQEVIKAGEERTITVQLENIDKTVSEHRVYCQLHPKHVTATLKVTGN